MKLKSQSRRPRFYRLKLEALEDRTLLSTFMVDRLTDAGEGSDLAGDLRYCLTQAADADNIQFGVQGVIKLNHSLPGLTKSVRIDGPGADLLTVMGSEGYSRFKVASGATVEISGLTIATGSTHDGGGIYNDGTLSVSNCTFSGNSADGLGGGGIFNSGSGVLTVSDSTFSANRGPTANGGAILNFGALTVTSSTFSRNRATIGGAIDNLGSGSVKISNSTLSENSGDGGAIDNNGGTLVVSNSTLSGNTAGDGGGGAILNQAGTLTVSNSTLSGNSAGFFGTAISMSGGSLSLSNSIISGNRAGFDADGAISLGGTTATISNCTISGNISHLGSIVSGGTVTISNSTISGNSASMPESAGGIRNSGTLTVINSTISGNTGGVANSAGGIVNIAYADRDATATLLNSSIANNTATGSSRIGTQLFSGHPSTGSGKATVQFRNTIISGDGSRPNLFAGNGGFVSQGHNLSSDDASGFLTAPGDLTNTNPMLGTLQDNGGPTQTRALLPGSPAVDAGDNTDTPDFDQRGLTRIVAGTIDIGAFEAQIGPAKSFQVGAPAEVTSGAPFDVTVTALDAYRHIAVGYLGTVTFNSTDLDPGVVLPAGYTFTADDQGVHTFTAGVTLITVGSQTLTATDTADNTITASAAVTLDPGPAAPPGGAASQPVNQIGTAISTLAQRVEPAQNVSSVDHIFASHSAEETSSVWTLGPARGDCAP